MKFEPSPEWVEVNKKLDAVGKARGPRDFVARFDAVFAALRVAERVPVVVKSKGELP